MSFIGEAIAGAALSALFDGLFNKLVTSDLLNFASEAQVCEEIKGWDKMLRKLHLVLDDADEKQIQNRLVKEWMRELKHLAYDVEDILDVFSTECLRRKVMGERQAASTSGIRKLIPACCTSFTPQAVLFNSDLMSKIREISKRFKGIMEEMKELSLVESVRKTSGKVCQRAPSSPVHDEPIVYGRDGDKVKILDFLFRYETSDAKVGVIPIVGMGGMGKTTLAKLLYNDDSILDHHFQVKAWVCVSDVFDIMRVTKGILDSITSQSSDLKDLSQVQLEVNRLLAGKKYFLVLDDVWNNNYDDWHALRSPLMDGAPGSKIIVTTRSVDVAKMIGTVKYHELKKLSDDDCWLLFKKHAFENRSIVAQPELEKIGREIVNKRCGGLPLAARTLGGLVRSKESRNEWEEVLNNKLWSLLDGNSNILPVLELSYYYLPSHLKRCFAYCAILPKDYEFERQDIILLWMAEGLLIPQPNDKKEMEDLGSDYFHDLVSRSIFQASSTDQSRFIMHDLVNDLAQKVAEDACLRLEDEVNIGENSRRERVRYSSYLQHYHDGTKRFAPFRSMKYLRTFLPLQMERYNYLYINSFLASCVPHDLLQNLKFLRVLSFCQYNIKELPDSIGDLKHLRYLDLSRTKIEALPESTTSLCNLQTLILRRCGNLKKLPTRMDELVNLRHLDITGADSIKGIPLEIKELKGLQTLSEIVLSKGFFSLSNLVSLKSLRGELCISNLYNVVDASDAMKAKLKDKEGIRVLELRWNIDFEVDEDGVQYGVFDRLQPHRNLKKLIIRFYGGTRFPDWIHDPMFNNIVHLSLWSCKKCTSLPQLGMLPNLKELFIRKMSSLQRIDQNFYGNNCSNPFPCLEVLWFEEMHNWEEWNAFEFKFRVLRELKIEDCENLIAALPSLPMLCVLEIKKCKEVDFRCKVDFSSLTRVVLVNVSSIMNLKKKGFLQRLKKFKELTVSDSEFLPDGSNLQCLFGGCPQLKSMVIDEDKEHLQMELAGSELESLTLEGCGVLEKLPAWIQKLMFLGKLTIHKWQSLVRFPGGGLPSMLKVLTIYKCESLAELTVYNSQCLEKLKIKNCDSLLCLGRRQLPPTLKKLCIERCKNLKSLLNEGDEGESETSSSSSSSSSINLVDFQIRHCESLASILSGSELPATLKCLEIKQCPNLTCVLSRGKLPSKLKSLCIADCEKVESIAGRFDYNMSLEAFSVSRCGNLKSLPDGLHNLINLRVFKLRGCLSIVSFPKGGFPMSYLRELTIGTSQICEPLFEHLNSLRYLCILGECGEIRWFPSDKAGMTLPPSLTYLKIRNFPNLKFLSSWAFSNLTSLEYLSIRECPKLTSFPENGLPDSLLVLEVFDCPILKQRCEEGKEPEWSKIRNIPQVTFDDYFWRDN